LPNYRSSSPDRRALAYVATLLHFWGERVKDFIERRLTLVTTVIAVGIVGGFVALRLF
jgi:hypothetical protein